MFHIKRIVPIIIIPTVNKNTPPWLGGVSAVGLQKKQNPMVSDALFLQGQLSRGNRNWSLTLGTHGHFLCWLRSSELIVQDSDLTVRLSPKSGGLSFRSRRIQKPCTLWPSCFLSAYLWWIPPSRTASCNHIFSSQSPGRSVMVLMSTPPYLVISWLSIPIFATTQFPKVVQFYRQGENVHRGLVLSW